MKPLYQTLTTAQKTKLKKRLEQIQLMTGLNERIYEQDHRLTLEQEQLSALCTDRMKFLMGLLS
jgi:propanediol dehydratase small subunit